MARSTFSVLACRPAEQNEPRVCAGSRGSLRGVRHLSSLKVIGVVALGHNGTAVIRQLQPGYYARS